MDRLTVRDAVYKTLANDPELNRLLARSTVPGMQGAPAIYETWAAEDTPFPYINMTWSFSPGEQHWIKRRGIVTFDIFMNNADTITAERIGKRLSELLDHTETYDPEDGYISSYLDGEGDYIEDEPQIVHITMDFTIDHYRLGFIQKQEEAKINGNQ